METTKAALARELKISRSRLSQLARAGMPVLRDGRLNRSDVLQWLTTSPFVSAELAEKSAILLRRGNVFNDSTSISPEFALGAVIALQDSLSPSALTQIGEWAIAIGLEGWQAVGLVAFWQTWSLTRLERYSFIAGLDALALIEKTKDPDWNRIADKAGEPVDVKGSLERVNALIDKFKTHPGGDL